MFVINYLNRNITDAYFPAFEIIYGSEILLMCILAILSGPIISAMWRCSTHTNLKLRFILAFVHAGIGTISRLIVLVHQITGPIEQEISVKILFCSWLREGFNAYFTTLYALYRMATFRMVFRIFFLAFDRFVASKAWRWYESGVPSTTVFFFILEFVHSLNAYSIGYLVVFGYISDMQITLYCGVVLLIGAAIYIIVFRTDKEQLINLKSRITTTSYSVARMYQLRENITLMKSISRASFPFVIFTSPVFIFYPIYSLTPKNSGFDHIRYFSVALYDAWIAVIALVGICGLPFCVPKVVRYLPKSLQPLFRDHTKVEGIVRNIGSETEAYFDMLNADLHKPSLDTRQNKYI